MIPTEGVNTALWLIAVSEHPDTLDSDVVVAAALVLADATSADDMDLDLAPEDVDDCIEELESLGFLRAVVVDDRECIYELMLPEDAQCT